ncbi:MAG: Ricin lectin [Cyanobacteria bacterium RYN_339]|nr:Ricin lectin [Cyanobacteria bacterium RYN_339]
MTVWSVNLNPNRLDPDLDPENLRRAAPGAFAQLEALGVGGIRVDIFWHALQPQHGAVDLAMLRWYRDFFAEARRRGLQIYALLYHPPRWAMQLLQDNPEDFLIAWRDFCTLVAEEFGGMLALVQPWNEPNNFLAALKGDPVLFHTRKIGPVTLPVGVPWETLTALFKITRQVMPRECKVVFNVLANLCPFIPASCGWLDWEHFADRFMALAHPWVDVIALDHYPDTWAPGTGPLEWDCLDLAARKAVDPASPWHRKTVILGEVGYSSAPNFRVGLANFFPGTRGEAPMADWYARALPCIVDKLARFPHNQCHWVNMYELFDPLRELTGHPALAIENHFGLIRKDYTRKPAFDTVQAAIAGNFSTLPAPWRTREPFYWRVARWGRRLDARLRPSPVLEKLIPQASELSPEPPYPARSS